MRQGLRSHLTYANVISTLALFLVLGGGTALAAYVVGSNSQIGPGTVSGHAGTATNKNIISGSVNATDLANQAVTAAKIKAPEAWHGVSAGSTTNDACANSSTTAVFCSVPVGMAYSPWQNHGGGFANAGFYKDQLGIVHLKGVIRNELGDSPTAGVRAIFRLPAAYAPSHQRIFATVGRDTVNNQEVAQARVDVAPSGLVYFENDCGGILGGPNTEYVCSGSGGYVSLDSISFRRDG